jgi:hypothetical protein
MHDKGGAHILLLLPVPKSIMICLLLEGNECHRTVENTMIGALPIEEHHRAWIVQLVHLNVL